MTVLSNDVVLDVVQADPNVVLEEQQAVDVLRAFTVREGNRLSLPQIAIRARLDLAVTAIVLADLEVRGAVAKEDLGEGRLRYRLKSPPRRPRAS